jgi:hypothetical protein
MDFPDFREEDFIRVNPKDYILSFCANSNIGNFREAEEVVDIIFHHLRNTKDIIPAVTEHQGLQLANRGLVSLSFFRDYMLHLHNRYGYPKPDFYIEKSKIEYEGAGKDYLSMHFESWIDFLQETFKPKLKKLKDRGIMAGLVYKTSKFHKSYD